MTNYLKVKQQKTFKIPLQSEVSDFIKLKKNWPQKFCDYYAERFWSFYQSNGWKVSGRALMKDWQCAFTSNWQTLKFKEDIDYLNKCVASDPAIPVEKKGNALLNSWLTQYSKAWDKITDGDLAGVYDYLKSARRIVMTEPEKERAKRTADGNIIKGKALCVKIIFDRMITNNQIF